MSYFKPIDSNSPSFSNQNALNSGRKPSIESTESKTQEVSGQHLKKEAGSTFGYFKQRLWNLVTLRDLTSPTSQSIPSATSSVEEGIPRSMSMPVMGGHPLKVARPLTPMTSVPVKPGPSNREKMQDFIRQRGNTLEGAFTHYVDDIGMVKAALLLCYDSSLTQPRFFKEILKTLVKADRKQVIECIFEYLVGCEKVGDPVFSQIINDIIFIAKDSESGKTLSFLSDFCTKYSIEPIEFNALLILKDNSYLDTTKILKSRINEIMMKTYMDILNHNPGSLISNVYKDLEEDQVGLVPLILTFIELKQPSDELLQKWLQSLKTEWILYYRTPNPIRKELEEAIHILQSNNLDSSILDSWLISYNEQRAQARKVEKTDVPKVEFCDDNQNTLPGLKIREIADRMAALRDFDLETLGLIPS